MSARILLVFGMIASGCAYRPVSKSAICTGVDCYEVGDLGSEWRSVGHDDGAAEYFNATNGGVILSYASCRDDAEAAPLSSLTAHLLVGYSDRQERSSEVLPFAHREALRTVVDAKLDGVPVVLDLYVFKSNGCVFDLSFVARPAGYDAGLADFRRFVEGFQQLPRPRA